MRRYPIAAAGNDLLVQELLHKQIARISVENLSCDIDVRFLGGYWAKTFAADPDGDESWYFRDRRAGPVITDSPKGLRLDVRDPG